MTIKRCDSVEKTESGAVTASPAFLFGYLVGMDGVNDVRMSIHNGTDENDEEKVPSNTYDASVLNANGALFGIAPVYCPDGIYLHVESGSNYEIVVYFVTDLDAHEARHWQH